MGLPCFGKYDENTTTYHEEHCETCDQVRVCLYQIGVQNIVVVGKFFIRPKPEEASNCFAYYYDRSHRQREPDCEDLCKFFTGCIKATLSAMKFYHESSVLETSGVKQMDVASEPKQREPQLKEPDKATSRFEVIELDGGESTQ